MRLDCTLETLAAVIKPADAAGTTAATHRRRCSETSASYCKVRFTGFTDASAVGHGRHNQKSCFFVGYHTDFRRHPTNLFGMRAALVNILTLMLTTLQFFC
jgi:hypothetical protein